MKAFPSLTSVPSWVLCQQQEQRWRITSGMSLELSAKRFNLTGVQPSPASRHNKLFPEGLFAHSPAVCRGLEVVAVRLHHQHILFLSFLSSITSSSLLTFFFHCCTLVFFSPHLPACFLFTYHPLFLALCSYIRYRDQRTDDLSLRIFFSVPLVSSSPLPQHQLQTFWWFCCNLCCVCVHVNAIA